MAAGLGRKTAGVNFAMDAPGISHFPCTLKRHQDSQRTLAKIWTAEIPSGATLERNREDAKRKQTKAEGAI